jgi:hypothetical protein
MQACVCLVPYCRLFADLTAMCPSLPLQTITSLCLDGSGTRLMSGALDGHVKVYDLQSYGMVYGMKYPSPILSMACAVRGTAALDIGGLPVSLRPRCSVIQPLFSHVYLPDFSLTTPGWL